MKTPISYYGGKQTLAPIILGLIPPHRIYCEPFIGGGAVFFSKTPSKVEIINDTNGEIVNFYEVLKRDFWALQHEIEISLHSRLRHKQAQVINANPEMFDRVKRAWAVWLLTNGSYGCMIDGGFGFDKTGCCSKKLDIKRANFTADYAMRLQRTQIECCDALRIIRSRDTDETFFYLDPPYVGADQGHYDGYTQEDFDALLTLLEGIQGKFLLSSFRNKSLVEFTKRNGWHSVELQMACSMTHNTKAKRQKIEVFTANYPISITLDSRKKTKVLSGDGEAAA